MQQHFARGFQRKGAVVYAALSVTILAVMTGPIASGASLTVKGSTEHTTTTVRPDLSYYRGKTITWYTSSGNPQLEATLWGNYLASYLHATVNVVPVAGISSNSADQAAAAPPNGLAIGQETTGSALTGFYLNASAIDFNIKKVKWISGIPVSAFILVGCANSPYHSVGQVLSSSSPVNVVNYQTGGPAVSQYLMYQAYKVPSRFISGYTSASQATGCIRGDGQVAISPISSYENAALNALVPGITPLALLESIPQGSTSAFLNNSAPLLTKYLAQHPPKTVAGKKEVAVVEALNAANLQGYFTSAGTPAKYVAALTAAFTAASKTPSVRQGFVNLGVSPKTIDPKVITQRVITGIKQQPLIAKYLAAGHDLWTLNHRD